MGIEGKAVPERTVAIVGAGNMASEHARAFSALPGVRVAGICSRTRGRAETLAGEYGAATFDTIPALYEGTKADIVVIAVSETSMKSVCAAAFVYPWVCLLEKPVGVDLSDAREILATATKEGARVWVGLNRRSYASTRAALTEVYQSSGSVLVTVLDQQDMAFARSIGTSEQVVQNYMYANSIHLIDYFQVFCRGSVARIDVSIPWNPENPTNVVATIHYSSGDVGLYQALWNGPGPWAVAICTSAARLEMRPLEQLSVQRRGERRAVPIDIDPIDTHYKPGLVAQAREVLKGLDGGKPSLASLDMAVGTMALCASIYGLG